MDSKPTTGVIKGKDGLPMSDDEIDYMLDYAQFSGNAGVNVGEWQEMEREDAARRDEDWREYLEFKKMRPGLTGVVFDGKITSFPKKKLDLDAGTAGAAASSRPLKPGKGLCHKCDCVVTLEGHESRCAKPVFGDSEQSDRVRRLAWLGGAVHLLDVRRYLVAIGTDVADLEVKSQFYCSSAARARYYRANPGTEALPNGGGRSDSTCAGFFNASYVGSYRREYQRKLLSVVDRQVTFPGYLEPHFKGFPYN